jgi:hypothetical protein
MLDALLGSRITTRALIVCGTLGLVFAWRLDAALKTAYDTDWVVPGDDLRLPTAAWSLAHVVVGVFAVAFLAGAALLWRRREVPNVLSGPLGPTSGVLAGLAVALAVAAGGARWLAAHDGGKGAVTAVVALNGVALLALLTLALVNGNRFAAGGQGLAVLFGRVLARQRMNVVVVFALVAALALIGDTSGQAIDSIRSWTPLVLDGGHFHWSSFGAARLTLGLASAVLLALVVYESGLRLAQAEVGLDPPPFAQHLVLALAITAAGALGWWLLPLGPGLLLLGVGLLLIVALDIPDLPGPALTEEALLPAELNAAEWLAIVPLLGLAATSVTAAVEAGLAGGVNTNALVMLGPALILGSVAVVFTRRVHVRKMEEVGALARLLVAAAIVVASLLILFFARRWLAALWGLAWLVSLVAYAWWLFQHDAGEDAPWRRFSVPVAAAGGIAVLLGIHAEPLGVGKLLGVFTLALLALAAAVLLLHIAVRATLHLRPPTLLWWFGLRQLPVLTLLLAWWIAVGVVQTFIGPVSLHDARLTDRIRVGRSSATPPLERAFDRWTTAQSDLRGPARQGPVPLVLVAAHGGGIRAAYWTAAALDCLVGVSAQNLDPSTLDSVDEDVRNAEREATCTSRRRTLPQQQVAARRIFMASGVSGGAVGLYAYARELLHKGWLGPGQGWLDQRLADDFAAPTVGWALYHDVPNRLLGLHPDTGAPCGRTFFGTCLRQDRGAVLEESFDDEWRGLQSGWAQLRRSYELRYAKRGTLVRRRASLLPLLVMNATLTGGKARAVISAANLGSWPAADADDPERGNDRLPLAGTVEVRDALCESNDLRLSTAAVLAARFPYVTPSGRIAGRCGDDGADPRDKRAACAIESAKRCEGRFVDGGYAENSGLFTLVNVWPSLRSLIVDYNVKARAQGRRQIAPMIVEIDNHYQASLRASVPSGGIASETLIPPATAFGSRDAMQTFARAAAYRILPSECTITISPSLHPGLIAPLGWELSRAAREDLRSGLTRKYPADASGTAMVRRLRQIQARLAAPSERKVVVGKPLARCRPRLPPP